MITLLLKLIYVIRRFIEKFKPQITSMETNVKSEVSGLTKVATLKSLTLDENGNYSMTLGYQLKDANGIVLNYDDAAKSTLTITGSAVDPAVNTTDYTPEQSRDNTVISGIVAIFNRVVPDRV